jgi:hypothetical protein
MIDGESEDGLTGRLKAVGVAADQAAAAAAAFQARRPEMRAHMVEATAQVRTMPAGKHVSAHAAQRPQLQDNTHVEQTVNLQRTRAACCAGSGGKGVRAGGPVVAQCLSTC